MGKWPLVRLGDVCEFIRNGASIKQDNSKKGFPITRIETISNGVFDRSKMGYAGIYDLGKYEDYVLKTGDILMSHINSISHLGKTAYYENINNETIIHGMNLLCLRLKKEQVNYRYTFYYLNSPFFKRQIPRITKKSVNQASFTVTALKELQFIFPPLNIQKYIADTLDKTQEIIDGYKKQLAELDNLIKAVFYEMFGDPVTNEKHWDQKKLSMLSSLVSGGTPSREFPEYFNGDIPWITTVALGKLFISDEDAVEYITEDAVENSATKKIPPGSVLFGVRVGVGKVAINLVEMCTNQDVVAITDIDKRLNNIFLMETLKKYSRLYSSQQRGATIKGITSKILQDTLIPIPPFDLQNKFADIVTKIEEQKILVKKAITESEHLFNSLMSEYFD